MKVEAVTPGYRGNRRVARLAGSQETTPSDLANATYEFTPARDEQAVEDQGLVAAREATSRSRLPERFKAMTAAEMSARIDAQSKEGF